MFKRILVANRGEIAVRVMRTCREMGISPLAVYSEPDSTALHVRMADRALCIGPAATRQSYLDIDKILHAAKTMGADAIHPGYGFLSENAEFARACETSGIVFIGPSPESITAMGDKIIARQHMQQAGVPVVPGDDGIVDAAHAWTAAQKIGLPVMLKATAGGGGKGMRLVTEADRVVAAYEAAQREAIAAFGNGQMYIEKFIAQPRHVEVQVMADTHGNAVHLFERDCSIQRRHQKVIEETPSPVLDEKTRQQMGEVAVKAAKAVNYRGAGTIEFLYGGHGQFYFLEMNTRLQVEHPITELCTGIDLVRWQILVADGQALPLAQSQIKARGAAIECRLYAEDPINFLPSPGTIRTLRFAQGPGVRIDAGVDEGSSISPHYDPMIAKIAVWAEDRALALGRMKRVLDECCVTGIACNLSFHRRVLQLPDFVAGHYDTGFIAAHQAALQESSDPKSIDDDKADAIYLAAAAIARSHPAMQHTNNTVEPIHGTSHHWKNAVQWRRN